MPLSQNMETTPINANQTVAATREIEVKAKILKEEFVATKDWLDSHATFLGIVEQAEIYFDNPTSSFFFKSAYGDFMDANDYLRIRTERDKYILCFKRVYRDESSGNRPYCDEYETEVRDLQSMKKMLEFLGFSKEYKLDKKRTKYKWENFEIVLDQIKNLGEFIEVEFKGNSKSPSLTLDQIEEFMCTKLSLRNLKKQSHGYLSMIVNPEFDFSIK